MALPHQVPLYNALDAVDNQDFEAAELAVSQFFEALENDPIAKDCRRQHFDRQVFEADFLSILIKEEIDAWGVLATVKLSRDDLEGARADCFRMIELIDQYYGFDTPSWQSPEARIPINPELMSRYFQIASLLTVIYDHLGDPEMSKRWANVRKTAVSDIQQPEEVWGRWISEADASLAVGITIYEFSDWQIEKREADGRQWLANIYRSLTERISPQEMNWLVSIHIPTDQSAEVPSKAMRWKIWSLRLAVAARLHRTQVGAYFGELQTLGERILLYYTTSEDEARDALCHILEDASELNPVLEIRRDEGWKEYSKWGDSSIIVSSPLAVPMPEPAEDEHANDRLLRRIWQACESIHCTSTRLHLLAQHLSNLPPHGDEFKKFCIEYLFALANLTENKAGYFVLASKLPKVDAAAAIRAFDELWDDAYPIEHDNQNALSSLAEAIAEVAPLKGLQVERALRKHGYALVHTTSAKVAKELAANDRELAMEIVQEARKGLIEGDGQDFDKASFLTDLAGNISDFSPEFAREMLIEAEAYVQEITSCQTKDQAYLHVLNLTEKLARDKLPEFCKRAIENAINLETDDPGYWGFGGPRKAIFSQAYLVRYVAAYDKNAALELLIHAFELLKKFNDDAFGRILYLSNLAESAAFISASENRVLAEELWSELKKSMDEVSAQDSYFLNRRFETGSSSPIIPFVKMNLAVAEERFTAILSICKATNLPEREVTLLCTFASELNDEFPKRAKDLLALADERANECSSEQLRAESHMLVAATRDKIGLDCKKEFQSIRQLVLETFTETDRFHLLLDLAAMFGPDSPQRSELLDEATSIFEANEIEHRDVMEKIKQFTPSQCSKLFFLLLDSDSNESQRSSALHWFSSRLAGKDNDNSDE